MSEPTLGNGKICYVEIPANDIKASSTFYKNVFGWQVRTRDDGSTAFDDGVGQVSGTWVLNRKPHGDSGLNIYIMVDDAEEIMQKIVKEGGKITHGIGAHTPEITAKFSDPAGNIFSIFQERG
ncbi:MAG: VOC family protein [Bacteroidetes bacterium]|nr:VOC family protein [Bacteroidota bacterium]